jgi:hypothetical protein
VELIMTRKLTVWLRNSYFGLVAKGVSSCGGVSSPPFLLSSSKVEFIKSSAKGELPK